MFVSTASSLRLNIKPIIMLMSNDLVKAFLLHTNVNSAVSISMQQSDNIAPFG